MLILLIPYNFQSKNQFGDCKSTTAFIVERDFPGEIVTKPTNMIGVKGAGISQVCITIYNYLICS